MGEIRIVGPGKTRGYPYPVCKNLFVMASSCTRILLFFPQGLNYNYLYSLNAWLLVNPWWLCFDWSMGCVPVIESFSDPRIIAGVAVWIIVGALLFTCTKTAITRDQR